MSLSVRSQEKCHQVCGAEVQLGQQGGQVAGFGGVFAMATGGPPQICSLECESPDCSLGNNGARWKSPELEAGLAMQLLMLHTEKNHKEHPVQTVEAGSQKRRAEKVSRPTIKMGSVPVPFQF